MTKIKSAILRPRKGHPLPTFTELEDQLQCKVLFGLGKDNSSQLPTQSLKNVVERFRWAEIVFEGESIDDQPAAVELVLLDNGVNDVLFTLRWAEVVVCRFELDEVTISEIYRLSDGLRILVDTRFVIQEQIDDIDMFRERKFGDNDFQSYLPIACDHLQRYISELQRSIDVTGMESKKLFFSGW